MSVKKRKGVLREYVEAILVALLLAMVIRSFIVEAFKIPSSSMVPTLLVGDHIFVNKFRYGLRIPFTKSWPVHLHEAARGEVIVFIYPEDESKDFIKRVVGLPGDEIRLEGHDLWVNGKQVLHESISPPDGVEESGYVYYRETHDGKSYIIRYDRYGGQFDETYTVPGDGLFVMGDNRDNSQDSRVWGPVPLENLKGRAMFIWLSRDHIHGGVRWNRFGTGIE
jgi:signal peptidase I